MQVADGSSTSVYGWTDGLRVRPPTHLPSSDGSAARITTLPTMRCLVADVSEDFIVGIDCIQP